MSRLMNLQHHKWPVVTPAGLSIALVNAQYKTTYPNSTKTIATTFGPASTDRRILVSVMAVGSGVSAITIGGVSATIHGSTELASTGYYVYWASAVVPTGTSGNIVGVTGVIGNEFYGGATYAITGGPSVFDNISGVTVSNSNSLAVAANSVAAAQHLIDSTTTPTASWDAGLTSDAIVALPAWGEFQFLASGDFATAQTVSYTCTTSGTTGLVRYGTTAVSFKPA
jgi:hypothetical protein